MRVPFGRRKPEAPSIYSNMPVDEYAAAIRTPIAWALQSICAISLSRALTTIKNGEPAVLHLPKTAHAFFRAQPGRFTGIADILHEGTASVLIDAHVVDVDSTTRQGFGVDVMRFVDLGIGDVSRDINLLSYVVVIATICIAAQVEIPDSVQRIYTGLEKAA